MDIQAVKNAILVIPDLWGTQSDVDWRSTSWK